MMTIGKMYLKNNGGFVVRLEFEYYNKGTNKWIHAKGTGDITLGFGKTVDPGDYGVPDGCLCQLYANVAWGVDREAKEMFVYAKGDGHTANYTISGTTLAAHLEFRGVSDLRAKAGPVAEESDSIHPDALLDYAALSAEQLAEVKENLESAPLSQNGSFGPLGWNVTLNLDPGDFRKSCIMAKITLLNFEVLNTELNAQNPKAALNLSVAGIGMTGELGVDFDQRYVYLKGQLNFVAYKKKFDIKVLNF